MSITSLEETAYKLAESAAENGVFPDYFAVDMEVEKSGFAQEILRHASHGELSEPLVFTYPHTGAKIVLHLGDSGRGTNVLNVDSFEYPPRNYKLDYNALRSGLKDALS